MSIHGAPLFFSSIRISATLPSFATMVLRRERNDSATNVPPNGSFGRVRLIAQADAGCTCGRDNVVARLHTLFLADYVVYRNCHEMG